MGAFRQQSCLLRGHVLDQCMDAGCCTVVDLRRKQAARRSAALPGAHPLDFEHRLDAIVDQLVEATATLTLARVIQAVGVQRSLVPLQLAQGILAGQAVHGVPGQEDTTMARFRCSQRCLHADDPAQRELRPLHAFLRIRSMARGVDECPAEYQRREHDEAPRPQQPASRLAGARTPPTSLVHVMRSVRYAVSSTGGMPQRCGRNLKEEARSPIPCSCCQMTGRDLRADQVAITS